VPLSTSNSKLGHWGKAWIFGIVLAVLALGILETIWRIGGHQPTIVDDQRLWAIERSRIGKSDSEIVLLGSSRMQTDISIHTLKQLAPNSAIINLSADGTCANAVLRDLAADKTFKGLVIAETTSECIMFGNDPGLSQQFYVDYYHKTYNLNLAANRHIATFLQKHIVVIDPYLNLIKVAGDLVIKKKWRSPNYLTTYENRSRAADYSKLDIDRHKSMRLQKVDAHYRTLAPIISPLLLETQASFLDSAVKAIQARGGHVAFVRFPVSDEHWDIDEQYFPRDSYWVPLFSTTSALILHFKDIEGINALQCPDTSHLDEKDTAIFTKILYYEVLHILF